MKHIIIIESDKPLLDGNLVHFRAECIEACNKIAQKWVGSSFIETAFAKQSAVRAVCELYNVDTTFLDVN